MMVEVVVVVVVVSVVVVGSDASSTGSYRGRISEVRTNTMTPNFINIFFPDYYDQHVDWFDQPRHNLGH